MNVNYDVMATSLTEKKEGTTARYKALRHIKAKERNKANVKKKSQEARSGFRNHITLTAATNQINSPSHLLNHFHGKLSKFVTMKKVTFLNLKMKYTLVNSWKTVIKKYPRTNKS